MDMLAESELNSPSESPLFQVDKVNLGYPIYSKFVAAQVANNVLGLALSTGTILRINLNEPEKVKDIQLPSQVSTTGQIRRLFLDPTGSHMIITTVRGYNYYLHLQHSKPSLLPAFRNVCIESVGWHPAQPTSSTREILIGDSEGHIYETFIESTFGTSDDAKALYKISIYKALEPIIGIHLDTFGNTKVGHTTVENRRALVATPGSLRHFVSTVPRSRDPKSALHAEFFKSRDPEVSYATGQGSTGWSSLVVSPSALNPQQSANSLPSFEREFAWLSPARIQHGRLLRKDSTGATGVSSNLAKELLSQSRILLPLTSDLPKTVTESDDQADETPTVRAIALTQWHIIQFIGSRLVIINQLDHSVVFDQRLPKSVNSQTFVNLTADLTANTFWLFTETEIFEIIAIDESRDVWRIFLDQKDFSAAQKHAATLTQKDTVATAMGDHLLTEGKYIEAAQAFSQSSKPFEQVALAFLDKDETDALRTYMSARLALFKPSAAMQRSMLATWLVELYMSKLNELDDSILTGSGITTKPITTVATPNQDKGAQLAQALDNIRKEFQEFVQKYKADLQPSAIYKIISNHGREEELLFYAASVSDNNYILNYWVQRERWDRTLDVLKQQTDPELFYKYSTVLVSNLPGPTVDVMMRQNNLEPRKLIPALLNYNRGANDLPLEKNEAIRYLEFVVKNRRSTDPAIHNTLISLYASHPSPDESALLSYLQSQAAASSDVDSEDSPPYDVDFALRLCVQYKRVRSCVHMYVSMGQYAQAVKLALRYGQVELASGVADHPGLGNSLRKKLWLAIAKHVISGPVDGALDPAAKTQGPDTTSSPPSKESGSKPAKGPSSIQATVSFLKRCSLLKIQDLIPFFPDFILIDDFRDEICAALGEYTTQIEDLHREMDQCATAVSRIRRDVAALDQRFVFVSSGERCWVCGLPLLAKPFYVFPSCLHGVHSDCAAHKVVTSYWRGLNARRGRGSRMRTKEESSDDDEHGRDGVNGTKVSQPWPLNEKSGGGVRPGGDGYGTGSESESEEDFVTDGDIHRDSNDLFNNRSVKTRLLPGRKAVLRIQEIQSALPSAMMVDKRENLVAELDSLVAESCVMCGESAVQTLDEPFISEADRPGLEDEWAL